MIKAIKEYHDVTPTAGDIAFNKACQDGADRCNDEIIIEVVNRNSNVKINKDMLELFKHICQQFIFVEEDGYVVINHVVYDVQTFVERMIKTNNAYTKLKEENYENSPDEVFHEIKPLIKDWNKICLRLKLADMICENCEDMCDEDNVIINQKNGWYCGTCLFGFDHQPGAF